MSGHDFLNGKLDEKKRRDRNPGDRLCICMEGRNSSIHDFVSLMYEILIILCKIQTSSLIRTHLSLSRLHLESFFLFLVLLGLIYFYFNQSTNQLHNFYLYLINFNPQPRIIPIIILIKKIQ